MRIGFTWRASVQRGHLRTTFAVPSGQAKAAISGRRLNSASDGKLARRLPITFRPPSDRRATPPGGISRATLQAGRTSKRLPDRRRSRYIRRERMKFEFGPEAEIRQTPSERLPSAFCTPEIDRTRVIHAVDAGRGAPSDRPLEDRFKGRPEFSPDGRGSPGKSVHVAKRPYGQGDSKATPERLSQYLLGRLGRPEPMELEFGPRPENQQTTPDRLLSDFRVLRCTHGGATLQAG